MKLRYLVVVLLILVAVVASAKTPQRIVSLAPACTEIVAGLGMASQLVGITQHTNYPPEVLRLPVVGSYVNPNLESIVSLKPDLVVATDDGNPEAVLNRLKELSVPLIVLNLRTYENIQDSIRSLGKMLGREKEAAVQASDMKDVAGCISERTKNAPRFSVLFVYESYPIMTAGRGTFTEQLVAMSGGKLITHDVAISYPTLTIENVIAKNPQIIIETSMDPNVEEKSKIAWWKQWPMIEAVKNRRVHVLESTHLDRPSQRIVLGLSLLASTLHPELFAKDNCLSTSSQEKSR
jgi:iron complex transport system substrate-binding protein